MQMQSDAKKMLKDYQGALKDLNNTNVFQHNDVITLQLRLGGVKRMLGHYQGTLKDLNKVDIFEPNDAIALQM
jgi:hypothetical protein